MRYRFSFWDAVVLLLVLAQVFAGVWVMGHMTGPVPTHWGADGTPDDFSSSAVSLWVMPVIMLLFYVGLRLFDCFVLVRRPEFYGFLTNVGGGMYGMISLLNGLSLDSIIRQTKMFPPLPVIGLFFVYLGWLFIRTPDIPVNSAGLFTDTKENRDKVRGVMGRAFVVTGLLTAVLGFLPGDWSVLSMVPLIGGTLLGILLALLKTK